MLSIYINNNLTKTEKSSNWEQEVRQANGSYQTVGNNCFKDAGRK